MGDRGFIISMGPESMIRDDVAYNKFCDEEMGPYFLTLPGVRSVKRFRVRAGAQLADPIYKYLNIYELTDTDLALDAIAQNKHRAPTTESFDGRSGTATIVFELIADSEADIRVDIRADSN